MMKPLLLPLYLILLISCNHNEQAQNDNLLNPETGKYAKELIDNGFLKYADDSRLDSLKTQLINSFDIFNESNYKIAHIDAEELAEFSFDFFLPNLNKILAKRNFKLSALKQNNKETSFDVLINGESIQLYTQKDLENNIIWDIAPRNFFKKVNDLLKAKNSNEQFYLLYGGNDLHTLLLTDKEFSIITSYYKDNDKERPYKP